MLAEDMDTVVSVTTDTGIARARELFGSSATAPVTVVRYPLDFSFAVRRFLDATRPDLVMLAELELWPNFVRACRKRGIPLVIGNGRLSDRSFKRYAALRFVLGRWFRGLSAVAAQDERYARRFEAVGADPERIHILGSMKWDAAPTPGEPIAGSDELANDLGIDRSRPLIVAGSTAPDEHALLHHATPAGVQLLCAPRRPEWFDDAAGDLPGCVRRTRPGSGDPSSDRFLLDTIGELRQAYALADLVVVGRSFGDLFGSDPMEPAAMGKPIVMGPACADFREAVEALDARGALVRTTRRGLATLLADLMPDHPRRAQMAEAAVLCVSRNRGASARHAALIRGLLIR
jgi:3-deoxy-D-manno-octulosonic-acid transferase